MVYCGKPSRGCQMCRTRRIKCDETKPTCLQCQKSRRQCPGYKDDFDLVFRNETKATERRARRSLKNKKGNHNNTQTGSGNRRDGDRKFSIVSSAGADAEMMYSTAGMDLAKIESSGNDPTSSDASGLQVGFTSSIEQQAPCYFMSNFVIIPQSGQMRGSFDWVLPLIKTEPSDSALSLSFQAVAMASLANRPSARGSKLMYSAIDQYAKALKVVNLALQNPVQQKTDQTLASILLLGFFETVTQEKTSITAWGSHIDGAVQIVKMRGKKQLRTKVGVALFQSVRGQMLINCLSSSKTPALGTEWWCADAQKDEGAAFVNRLNLEVAELRGDINRILMTHSRSPETSELISEIMHRAIELELEYQRWEETQTKQTVAWVDNIPGGDITKADVCPGRVDLYSDVFSCSSWNFSRVSRIFIAGIVIRCAAWICYPVDYRTTPEYAQMSRMGQEMICDIIASVPFMFGWHLDSEGRLKPGDIMGGGEDVMGVKALGAVHTIWPLLTVSCSDFTTDSQRLWIKGRFKFISDVIGLNQAKVVGCLQLRLPSMIVRRDNMGYASLTGPNSIRPLGKPAIMPALPSSISSLTFQQREAIKREMWERERKAAMEKEKVREVGRVVGVGGNSRRGSANGNALGGSVLLQYQQSKYGLGSNGGGGGGSGVVGFANGNASGNGNTSGNMQKTGELSWKVSNEQGNKRVRMVGNYCLIWKKVGEEMKSVGG
ncbi:43c764f5-66bf-4e82-bdf5-7b8cae458007 [Sclerotinia trifoliorum]|uniref:43c764f5-66bf-4e82-bdf5-7b8cae458007 n=1 Tax=Sclerotinia trifoliorum TaxID=28548 RepID=A0A8H2W4E3_9HELO|nr:43c764f5-66bf-4e82-bdf5-7b8cae458007 [Sclerotinia trifoliorum]